MELFHKSSFYIKVCFVQRKQMQPNKQLETDKLRQRESANKAGL